MRPLAVVTLLTIGLALGTAGCNLTSTEPSASKPNKVLKRYDQIYLTRQGNQIIDRHMGYLEHQLIVQDGIESVAHYVCTKSFEQLGYYFDDGVTYRFEGTNDTKATKIGTLEPTHVFEKLFGVEGTYQIRPGLPRS